MSKPAIEVKNLSKVYNIGHERKSSAGTVTLRDAITNVIRKPAELVTGHKLKKEKFWALKDINFEVNSGDVVGIIGRNGSGKSTLLKVMSRIVEPTNGEIIMRGKTASLLEVGTGFHPELTGRENIYFNGSILGMKKKEIEAKFDEIVAFSEVEKFLDTPVKYYSSGMYVRLAFAVAAHLEPDILIVDEVLAVGDAAFQKKCLGKMQDVAGQGRTVLFVSHNMATVTSLCKKGIFMENGKVSYAGSIIESVNRYINNNEKKSNGLFIRDQKSDNLIQSVSLKNDSNKLTQSFKYGDKLRIILKTNPNIGMDFGVELRIKDSQMQIIGYASSWISNPERFISGDMLEIVFDRLNLIQGHYTIDFICRIPKEKHVDNWWDTVNFHIIDSQPGLSPIAISENDQLGSFVLENVEFKKC